MIQSLDNLAECIIAWGEDKGILGYHNITPQFMKVQEEADELEEELEIIKDNWTTQEESDEALERAKLELGDVLVTLILLAEDLGTSANECLELAYEKIKDRQGRTINGTFIKEEDLDGYEE